MVFFFFFFFCNEPNPSLLSPTDHKVNPVCNNAEDGEGGAMSLLCVFFILTTFY